MLLVDIVEFFELFVNGLSASVLSPQVV